MTDFDSSQQRVLSLDPARHARVLGAPGSGKTRLVIESFARVSELPGWDEGDVLVLAPNRLVASELRHRIERRVARAMGGTPARTAPSLAFALLQLRANLQGEAVPRLLTGTAHDESVEQVIAALLDGRARPRESSPFAPEPLLSEPLLGELLPSEVLLSDAFRAELRELSRVLDDFGAQPLELLAALRDGSRPHADSTDRFAALWSAGLELLELVREMLERERPGELPASAMMREACAALHVDDALPVPRLVLVDDAAELGEGALALLAALAERGTKIWVFGDPDTATGAFQGERARVLAGLDAELGRRQSQSHGSGARMSEQYIVLDTVHRHGAEIRELIASLSSRIGVGGAGEQRRATALGEPTASAPAQGEAVEAAVQFATAHTFAEQLGMVAHRLRSARLGLGGSPALPWSQMAVICRSRGDAKRVSRLLAAQQVPTSIAAGGVVLREHQLVRELIRLLQHALGIAPLDAREVLELLGGAIGGLDPISLRRLRGALRVQEVRDAAAHSQQPRAADALVLEAFQFPGEQPVLDMRGARRLNRLGKLAAAGEAAHRGGGTPREVLWQLWEGSGLAHELQSQALDGRGTRADEAHRSLDAVVALFFALQRHEEQDSERPIDTLLEELLVSTVPEDSLAARSEREVVTVTTPQGAIGREFGIVCVLGLQDGAWPNLRARGSLLGVSALERWLRGEEAAAPSRRETMHDELRLLAHAAARARTQLLVLAVTSEEQHPSPFFALGRRYRIERALPSSRLTLRGATAEMRRRLVQHSSRPGVPGVPGDVEALDSLVALARAGVPGAHPDDWYGVAAPTTTAPLADIEHDPEATVAVSPSHMERAEACPLDWVVSRLGGGAADYRASIGTLLHRALETSAPGVSAEQILEQIVSQWGGLRFEAEWQSARALADTKEMSEALATYLARFERSEERLLAGEASFEIPLEFARLLGAADRIEAGLRQDGGIEVTVVDLKTGRRPPTAAELEQHAQLQAYQLGVVRGAFRDADGNPIETAQSAGARLVYVHPDALSASRRAKGERYLEVSQAGLDQQAQAAFVQRVLEVARVMAAASFTARVEHHCTSPHAPGRACALHIIPAVSHA